MASSSVSFLILVAAAVSAAAPAKADSGFNITDILSCLPNFGVFNDLLSRSGVAGDINCRSVLTVLVVDNAAAAEIASLPRQAAANALALHVLLDYYDSAKLKHLRPSGPTVITTLFQTTGSASGKQAFLNLTVSRDGHISFGPAEPGFGRSAELVTVLVEQPYDIAVLQVSRIIAPHVVTPVLSPPPAPLRASSGGGNRSPTQPPKGVLPVVPVSPSTPRQGEGRTVGSAQISSAATGTATVWNAGAFVIAASLWDFMLH